MQPTDPTRRRRWPFAIIAAVLVLLDLFMVLVFIEGATDSEEDAGGKTGGLITIGVIIALLSWLAFLAIRAFVRRGRPERMKIAEAKAPYHPSIGRRVGGTIIALVFFGIALLIGGIETAEMMHGDFSGASGLTGAAVCAAVGSFGMTMRRTPNAAQRADLLAAYNRALPDETGTAPDRAGGAPTPDRSAPSWLAVPVDRTVTARESMSEAWWLGLVGFVLLGAALIWAMTRIDINSAWVLLFLVPFVAVCFVLVAILIFLPYGIRLTGGALTVGAHGVPRIGRVWRRQDIPLDEVVAWAVWPRDRAKAQIPQSPFPDGNFAPPAGKPVTNWGNFVALNARDVLVVRVNPARVPAAMPATVMSGLGVQETTASTSDTGVYVIGTRHPDRWTRTLEKAMPSRRALT